MTWKKLMFRSVFTAIVALGVVHAATPQTVGAQAACGNHAGPLCLSICEEMCPGGEVCCDEYYYYWDIS